MGAGEHRGILDHREIVAQQLLFHSLTDRGTQNLLGLSGLLGFFLPHNGRGVKACSSPLPSPHFQGSRFLFQPQQQHQSLQAGNPPLLPAGLSRGVFPGIPGRNSSGLGRSTQGEAGTAPAPIPSPSSRRAGGITGGVWVATGQPAPLTGPGK